MYFVIPVMQNQCNTRLNILGASELWRSGNVSSRTHTHTDTRTWTYTHGHTHTHTHLFPFLLALTHSNRVFPVSPWIYNHPAWQSLVSVIIAVTLTPHRCVHSFVRILRKQTWTKTVFFFFPLSWKICLSCKTNRNNVVVPCSGVEQ